MPTTQVQEFAGLNRKAALEVAPASALYFGHNIDVTLGRSIRRRDGWKKVATLHPQSKGLYISGGTLRAAIPGGQGLPLESITSIRVKYDQLGAPQTIFQTGTITATKDSTMIVLAGGTWPTDIIGAKFYVPGRGYQGTVAARLNNSTISLDAVWNSATVAGAAFKLDGAPGAYPLNHMRRVAAVEQYGFSQELGSYPYLVVETYRDPSFTPDIAKGLVYEHHWVVNAYADPTIPANTYVELPFAPGPYLQKLNGRLWATDDTTSEVRFSSVQFGPRDWTTVGDAGFISAVANAFGNKHVSGLGVYNDLLAIIFPDSVQLWETAVDPQAIRFIRAMDGPGTDVFGSVTNVRGDLFYFTRGGFRSLHTQTVTGEVQEQDDIGASIYELTKDITAREAVAVWSQRRGSYLCSFGDTVYVYRWSPQAKIADWSDWTAPATIDYMVEFNGDLYIRCADDVYVMDQNYDDGAQFEAQFHFAYGKQRHTRKRWDFLEVVQEGTSTIDFAIEPTKPTVYTSDPPGAAMQVSGSTTGIDRLLIGAMSPMLSIRFRGNKPWQLDSFALTYAQLAW